MAIRLERMGMDEEGMRRRLAAALRDLLSEVADLREHVAAGAWSSAIWDSRGAFNAAARLQSACERAYADDLGGLQL